MNDRAAPGRPVAVGRTDIHGAATRHSVDDGRSSGPGSGSDAGFMPLVSENRTKLFT